MRAGPCPDHDTLALRLRRRLDPARNAEVEAHVDECEECRLVLATLVRDDPEPGEVAPETLGRYVLGERVGRGGMGEVIRAWDPELERVVAIKVVRVHATQDERGRLLREARLHARLSHPNVVPLYDVGIEGDTVYFAMQLIEGDSLATWLSETPRSMKAILDVFIDAGRGLAAAHRAGIVHRDFKPGNVLVADGGLVKVTDFGLAKTAWLAETAMAEPTDTAFSAKPDDPVAFSRPGQVEGTPRYMAPEHHGGADLTPAADQYAFCVALWEALVGAPPFSGEHPSAAKEQGPPPWPRESEVPVMVADAIRRGLSADAEDRWPSMDALLAAIGPEDARPDGAYAASDLRAARRARLNWLQGGVLALAVLVLYALKRLGLHQPGYPDALAVVALFGALAQRSRARLTRLGATVTIRRAHLGTLATCAAVLLLLSLAWAMGVAFTAALAFSMVLAACAAAWVAIALEWRFAFASAAFALTSIGIAWLPEQRGIVLAGGAALAYAAIAIAFHLRPPPRVE